MKIIDRIKKILTPKKIIILVIILAVAFLTFHYFEGKKDKQTSTKTVEYQVQRKNLTVTLSGSGTVTQAYRQDISPNVNGTVNKVNFKEGDKVKAGDLMFELDDTAVEKDIERTRLSIQQAQHDLDDVKKNIADTTVTSPISGQITGLSVNVGDDVGKGSVIGTIIDTSKLKLTVPFNKSQARNFYIGEKADVYLQDYMQTVEGTVSYVNKNGQAVDGGGSASDVEITIKNPGTIRADIRASASIGGQMSIDNAALEYSDTRKVKCEPGGTVKSISIHENQRVYAGQTIMTVDNPDLGDSLLSSQMKLEDLQAQLDSQLDEQKDYKITAPGNGTIVTQDIKPGAVVKQQDTISTIADNDSMQFDINIDELDIDKIKAGMKATVTLDALPGKDYAGIVTQVASEGTSSNGVSTYPVTIQIQNPTNIKAGMNANADIVIQQKDNVLTLPVAAVQKVGNMAFVFVKKQAGAAENSKAAPDNNFLGRNSGMTGSRNASGNQNGSSRNNSRMQSMTKALGPDVTIKRITIGINNEDDIEITSGLNEGDSVLVAVTTTSSSSTNALQGGPSMFGGGALGGNKNFQMYTNGGSSGNRRNTSSGGGQRGN